MTTHFVPDEQEKRGMLPHVFYEIEMLVLATMRPRDIDFPWLKTVLLESTLLHTRNMVAFFGTERKDLRGKFEDDVLAADYGFPACSLGIPRGEMDRLNKLLSHLTYSRIKYATLQKMYWDYSQIVRPVLLRVREFLEYVRNNPNYSIPGDIGRLQDINRLLMLVDLWLAQ